MSDATDLWDAEALDYDEPADHGLRDPEVRAAWRDLLLGVLPPAPARVADLGCGTATLSLLLAEQGYVVDGVDFSPAMVRRARAKVAGRTDVTVTEGDAAAPPLTPATYDVVLCRHVLWALPDPVAVLRRWSELLRPRGADRARRGQLVDGRRPDRRSRRSRSWPRPAGPRRCGTSPSRRTGAARSPTSATSSCQTAHLTCDHLVT